MEPREALKKASIFAKLEGDSLDGLSKSAKARKVRKGEVIVKEGDDAVGFYVVMAGEAEVVKGLGGDERVVGKLSPGDFFGEMALFDGFPRAVSVRALSDCEVLLLTRWVFLAAVRSNIEVALAVLPVMSKRLRECEDLLLP